MYFHLNKHHKKVMKAKKMFAVKVIRVGKNLENESLILTSNFKVFPSSNLRKP